MLHSCRNVLSVRQEVPQKGAEKPNGGYGMITRQPGRTTESTTSSPLCTRMLSGKRLSARLPSSVQVAQAAAPRTRRVPASACRNMLFVRCVSAPGPDRSAAAQLVSMAGQPAPLAPALAETCCR